MLRPRSIGHVPGSILLLILGALLLAACGGAAATGATGGDGGGAATQAPGETDAPPPTEAPATEPPGGGDGGAGGGDPATGDVCGLVTVAEMETLFGVSGVTQELFPGPPDTCDYRLDDAPFVAMVLSGPELGGGALFDAMAADGASASVGGIGDRALYNSQTLSFLVQRGDAVLSLQVLDETRTEEERLELMKQIGAIAAGRM